MLLYYLICKLLPLQLINVLETICNIAVIRLSKIKEVKTWPNPFISSLQVSIYSEVQTKVEMRVTDITGRTLQQQFNSLSRGNNWLRIGGLERLPAGTYLLEVINQLGNSTTTFKLIKQ